MCIRDRLKAKIQDAKIESSSSEDEQLDDGTDSEVEADDESVDEVDEVEDDGAVDDGTESEDESECRGIKPLELDPTPEGDEFEYEDIVYYRRKVSKQHRVFNEDDHEVGRWSKSKNMILFNEEEDWHKIHAEKVSELKK